MSKQVIEQVNDEMFIDLSTQKHSVSSRSANPTHFSLQVLEANSIKGGVQLLEIRPEQLTSNDLGGEQVCLEQDFSGADTSLLLLPLEGETTWDSSYLARVSSESQVD